MRTDPTAHRIVSGHATPKVVSVVNGQTANSPSIHARGIAFTPFLPIQHDDNALDVFHHPFA
jgi:hypothetical protein